MFDEYLKQMRSALEDARDRLTEDMARHEIGGLPVRINELHIQSWQQAREYDYPGSDANLRGFKTIEPEQVVIVASDLTGTAVVYHGGTFSYLVESANEEFWHAVDEHRLPRGDKAQAAIAVYSDRELDAQEQLDELEELDEDDADDESDDEQ